MQGFPLPDQPPACVAAGAGQVLALGGSRHGELGLGAPVEQFAERGRRLLLALGGLVPGSVLDPAGLQRADLPETGVRRAGQHGAPLHLEKPGQYRDRRVRRAVQDALGLARQTPARAHRRPGRPAALSNPETGTAPGSSAPRRGYG